MAQAQPQTTHEEETSILKEIQGTVKSIKDTDSVPFKFNAQAPEFVPRSLNTTAAQMPMSGCFYPYFHYLGATAGAGSDWFFVGDQDPTAYLISNTPNITLPNCPNKNGNLLTDDLRTKIIKQMEYQFSDMSLLANESMSKHINKDPEGYVPISVLASTKKIKSLMSNTDLLAQALRSSSKLVLSEEGKKVKRKIPFTDKDREELQSRIVVVENLPEDHSHQNVQKIFSVVGSVKTIRICHPQEPNSSGSKNDFFMTNKLHALVEFETREIAEKAVEKLNDERNWRKGLRVRLLLRCSPKSVLKSRKSELDNIWDDEDLPPTESMEDTSQPNNSESVVESYAEDSSGASKKAWTKGRGKGKGRGQNHSTGRSLFSASAKCVSSPQCEASAKLTSKGPRMPDGTKGFAVGRGKPLVTSALTNVITE